MSQARLKKIGYVAGVLALTLGFVCLAVQVYVLGAQLCALGIVVFVFMLFCWPYDFEPRALIETSRRRRVVSAIVVIAVVIAAVTLPMCLSPMWNGEYYTHRNQYESLAKSFLQGNLFLDYYVSPDLLKLDNPYDPEARYEAGVSFRWDSALYNGHYYMYFGVVPVLLVFVPFQVIAGSPLVGYHATQIFTAGYIIGLFLFMRVVRKKFFPRIRWLDFMFLFAAFALISTWYFATTPSLYCTAISSGVCMEVFSLYFFVRAVFVDEGQNRQIALAALGSLFGALAIGCRPTVAIANVVVVALLVIYLRKNKVTPALVLKLVLAALPYVVIIAGLFAYNYARFDNVLEFGQSYQLTVADQHQYGDLFTRLVESNVIFQLIKSFIWLRNEQGFPGVFFEYVLLIPALFVFVPSMRKQLKRHRMLWVVVAMWIAILVIVVSQALASPYLLERYKSDFLWMLSIMSYLFIACILENPPKNPRLIGFSTRLICAYTIISCVILFLVPNDANVTAYYLGL